MAFLYRATTNLRSFGHRERSGPVWAVFSWMIPIVNLYLPKRMVNDAWRGADARRAGWTSHRVPGIFLIWWLTHLLGLFLSGYRPSTDGLTPSEAVLEDRMGGVGGALLAVSALCAIFVFRSITNRHTERAGVLRQAHPATAPAHGAIGG
jgi:hypothetical protein